MCHLPDAGTDLAQVLTQKEVIAKKKAAMAPEVSKALARLSSGLYVVTAAQNDVRSAMVASWVSQVGGGAGRGCTGSRVHRAAAVECVSGGACSIGAGQTA